MTENHSTPTVTTSQDRRDEAEAVLDQVVRFVRMMKRASAKFASQQRDGIEQAAYFLLAVLVTEGPQRTTALAETVHSDTSTVSRQVGALVRHGLVERQADPADGRACLLAPTDEGLRVFEENRKQRSQWLADVLKDWSEEDRQTLTRLFGRLNTDIEEHSPQLAETASQAKGA